jgi:predicted nicotinamide N-methyase
MDRKTKILLAVMVGLTVIALGVATDKLQGLVSDFNVLADEVNGMEIRNIHNQFIDLNGDGKLDLLLSGEAIYNTTPLSDTMPLP